MGVVQRQAIKRSTLAYFGAFIGIASQLWVYPLAFDVYGDYQFLLSMISFILPFASFGIMSLVGRFYPYFEHENKGGGFLLFLIGSSVVFFTIFIILAMMFQKQYFAIIEWIGFDVDVFRKYNHIIIIGVFFSLFATIFSTFSFNYKRITVPYIFTHISWKLVIPILVILYYFNYMTNISVLESIYVINFLISVGLFFYIKRIGKFKLKVSKEDVRVMKQRMRPMVTYMSYGVFASIGSVLAFNMDKIMIRGYTTSIDTGVYSSMLILAGFVLYPYDSILSISNPIIAKAWKENDMSKLEELNRESSNVLTFVALFIFLLAYLNLDDILKISANYELYRTGLDVFFYLGIAKVVDSSFGLNGAILSFSKYFYFTFIAVLILAFTNLYLNIKLIPDLGMEGAAISSLVAISLANLFYYLYNVFVFKIQCFSINTIYILGTLIGAFLIAHSIHIDNFFIQVLAKSIVFLVITMPITLYFKLVPQLNDIVHKRFNIF